MATHPVFVPPTMAGSRRDTAVLLVGTAREFGIGQHDIQTTPSGFRITERLAAVIYDEHDNNETSGNRAAKKNSQKGNRP